MLRRSRCLILALALVAAPLAAASHPHVFVDGQVSFLTGSDERLSAVRIVWVMDPLYSMLLLAELGLDPVGRPDAAGRALLAGLHAEWIEGFGGGGALRGRDGTVELGAPRAVEADVVEGRIEIGFERPLDTPLPAGEAASLLLYDPLYFVAYTIAEVALEGPANCAVALHPFEPDGALAGLQRQLALLEADAVVPEPGIGRLFADRAVLTCD